MHGVHTVCDVASDGDVPFEHISAAMFDRMIGFHLRGTFMVTQRFYTGMATRRWGRIINFSSQLAYRALPAWRLMARSLSRGTGHTMRFGRPSPATLMWSAADAARDSGRRDGYRGRRKRDRAPTRAGSTSHARMAASSAKRPDGGSARASASNVISSAAKGQGSRL